MIFTRVSKNFLRRTKVKRKSKPENHHPDMWSLTVSDRSDLPSDVDIFELDVWEVSDALTDLLLKNIKITDHVISQCHQEVHSMDFVCVFGTRLQE